MKQSLLYRLPAILILGMISACGDNGAPAGPDLTGIDARDHTYFNEIFNRCNINNSVYDCNCVARINVEHRDAAYEKYKADYDTVHKPELETEIETRKATLEEKTKNASDERILEALEEDLHRLEQKLEAGIDNIDDFELPFLPAGATDSCVIGG